MRMQSAIQWSLGAALVLAVLSATAALTGSQSVQPPPNVVQPVPKDDAKEFQGRVQKYLDIQKKALSKLKPLSKETTDAAVIAKHQEQLAATIRMLRPNAMPGEIFTPWLKTTISGALKQQVKGKAGADAKATLLDEGNPKSPDAAPTAVKLTINGSYPEKAPLSTVPPSVLAALPVLPDGVEYRFVGHTMILRDTKANIIVDTLPNAF